MSTTTYRSEYYQKNKERILATHKKWRTANPDVVKKSITNWQASNEGHTYLDVSTGYMNYVTFEHPLSTASGMTREHRIVLFDVIGEGPHPCYWGCGKTLYWKPEEVMSILYLNQSYEARIDDE